jgi:hypothetical protein
MYLSLFWLLLGAVLVACSMTEVVDSYWSGMGGGLVGVGIAQLIRHIRYRKNEEYREKVDVETNDERNKFLTGKAWAWAGYLFVLVSGVATIALKVMVQDMWSLAASYALCLLLVLYWGSYLVLKRKY